MSTTNPPATQSTAVVEQKKAPVGVRDHLNSPAFAAAVAKALPKHMTPERQIRLALTAVTRVPKLLDCTPASVLRCMLDLSAAGLEPDGRRAHLIPYGKECTLVIDYKGKVELAFRSGMISKIHADVVCEHDVFEYDRGAVTAHKIDLRKPRGDAYAAYCIVTFKDGAEKADVMSKDDIERIRSRSKARSAGPWVTDWNEMAKKTVLHRALKLVPLSPEIREAIDSDDDTIDVETSHVSDTSASFTAMLTAPEDSIPTESAPVAESTTAEAKS